MALKDIISKCIIPSFSTSKNRVIGRLDFMVQNPIPPFIKHFIRDLYLYIKGKDGKNAYYRKRGAKIGYDVRMNGEIDPVNPHLVTIGDHTIIADKARILTHCPVNPGPVKIGCYVFIGYGAIILPNVTIGNGSLVGAGSVVTKDIPSLTVAVGNPAKIIRSRNLASLDTMIEAMEEGISVGQLRKRASQDEPKFTETPPDNPVIEGIPQENDVTIM
jgi:acetyltransferase-like isoleucine patch superfamily enzyme